jgi:hypothetical protein
LSNNIPHGVKEIFFRLILLYVVLLKKSIVFCGVFKVAIFLVIGRPGSGKTSFIASKAIEYMTVKADERLSLSWDKIHGYNLGGFYFSYPKDHIVYSDVPVTVDIPGYSVTSVYKVCLDDFRLPTDDDMLSNRPCFVPPHAVILFDEAASKLDARDWVNFAVSVREQYEKHRHWGLDIYLTCHGETSIDLSVRRLADCIIEPVSVSLRHSLFDFNSFVTTWDYRVYDNVFAFSSAGRGGLKGKNKRYSVPFNIFDCYDHEYYASLFLRNCENRDFDFLHHFASSNSVDGVRFFNALNKISVRNKK